AGSGGPIDFEAINGAGVGGTGVGAADVVAAGGLEGACCVTDDTVAGLGSVTAETVGGFSVVATVVGAAAVGGGAAGGGGVVGTGGVDFVPRPTPPQERQG